MERYIGIDVHAASCTLAVVSERGRLLRTMVVETNGEALVDAVRCIAGHRRVVFEEGTQAGWLVELLEPHVHEVVVALVPRSRGQEDDQGDAVGLAQALRQGAIERQVYKHTKQFRELSTGGQPGGHSAQNGRAQAVPGRAQTQRRIQTARELIVDPTVPVNPFTTFRVDCARSPAG